MTSRRIRARCWLGSVGLLCLGVGCGGNFTAESVVAGLRVLGLRAEPADLHPGETTQLDALVVNGAAQRMDFSMVWFSCDPDPFNLNRSACSDSATLSQSPLRRAANGQPTLPPGMRFLSVNLPPLLAAPVNLFEPLSADDPRRTTGTVAEILLIALADRLPLVPSLEQLQALFDRVQSRAVPSVMTLFRVRISNDPQRNHNPRLGRLRAGGEALPIGATLRLEVNRSVSLEIDVSDDSFEEYDQLTPSGIEHRQERLVAAYYATLGQITNDRVALRSGTTASLSLPGTSAMWGREGGFWVVVRDTRGGTSWIEAPVFVCDPSRAAPRITAAQGNVTQGGIEIAVQGSNLQEILELWVDDLLLRNVNLAPDGQTLRGSITGLGPGTHFLSFRATSCVDPSPMVLSF